MQNLSIMNPFEIADGFQLNEYNIVYDDICEVFSNGLPFIIHSKGNLTFRFEANIIEFND